MRDHRVDAVIHMAARKQVAESVRRPAWYFSQNVGALASILQAMELAEANALVFSSSAAVYGEIAVNRIREESATNPANPYGVTKLLGEQIMQSAADTGMVRGVSLRYFNVAGAGSPELGDPTAQNLVPMVIERIAAGQSPLIFGDDYDTPDGTCIRDFVHVSDLARGHVAVLERLLPPGPPRHEALNVGTGHGYSVREVIDAVSRAAEKEVVPVVVERREGDPACVVADPSLLIGSYDWTPLRNLDDIAVSAWRAHDAQIRGANLMEV